MDLQILKACCWLLVFLQIVFAVPMGVKISRDENRLDDGMFFSSQGCIALLIRGV